MFLFPKLNDTKSCFPFAYCVGVKLLTDSETHTHPIFQTIHLEDEVAMGAVAQAQVILVQVHPELGQVLILSADVCGQDQGAQLAFYV